MSKFATKWAFAKSLWCRVIKNKCMHILRVRGARDKCDCCDSRLKSRVQGLCSAGYGVATSDLNQVFFFSFFFNAMYRSAVCYDRCVIDRGKSIGRARCCFQARVQHACLVMLFLSRACFDVIPVAKQFHRIQPPIVTASKKL